MRTLIASALFLALGGCSATAIPVDNTTATAPSVTPVPAKPGSDAMPAPTSRDPLEAKIRSLAEIRRARSPSLSPDGKRIAYVSDRTGLPELYIVPTERGKPERVTSSLKDPVISAAWSPDGAWLAFSVAPGGGMNQQIYLIRHDGKDMRLITDGGQENNWLGDWTYDGKALARSSNRRDRAAMDAYIYDVQGGKLELVSKNPGVGSFTDATRHRKSALLSRVRSRGDNDLFLVDIRRGTEVLLTPHEGPGSFWGRFSADGKTVFLLSNKDRDRKAFAKIRLGGPKKVGPIEVIAAREDAELESFVVNDPGTMAVLVWNVGGRSELAFVNLEREKMTPEPDLPHELLLNPWLSKDGKLAAVSLAGPPRRSISGCSMSRPARGGR